MLRAFSCCGGRGLLSSGRAQLGVVASPLAHTGSRQVGSVVAPYGLSWPTACGVFPGQGLNLRLLHWHVDS